MGPKPELTGIRVSVAEAAEMMGKHPSHLRRLWKRGVLPAPRKTANGRPYFDDNLLKAIAAVVKSGIGLNGEEVLFYRRRAKSGRRNRTTLSTEPRPSAKSDPYIINLRHMLAQFGIPQDRLKLDAIQSQLVAAFGDKRPDIGEVLRELAKRLLA